MRAISDQARELRSQIQAQKKKMNMEWGSHFIPKCFLNKSQKRHPFVASRVTMTESRLSGLIIKSIILGLQISNKTLNPSTLHIFRCRSLRWPICQERSILPSVEGTELESLLLRQLKIQTRVGCCSFSQCSVDLRNDLIVEVPLPTVFKEALGICGKGYECYNKKLKMLSASSTPVASFDSALPFQPDPQMAVQSAPVERPQWNPYQNNMGTVMGE